MMEDLATHTWGPLRKGKKVHQHEVSFRDFVAFSIVHDDVRRAVANAPTGVPHHYPTATAAATAERALLPIGIIGAGTAGLYAAMILKDLGLDYEILEADSRIGGRLYTYRFNGEAGYDAAIHTPARYDYFDVGAMRYPNIPFSDRVFDLFRRINIQDLIIEYHLSSDNAFKYFNTRPPITSNIDPSPQDYFHVSDTNNGTVPFDYVQKGVDHWTGAVYDYYKKLFAQLDQGTPDERREKFKVAWDALTAQDHHSTRSYMLAGKEGKPTDAPPPYPTSVVEWLETFDSATGLYDEAFVESVIDSLDFGWPHPTKQPAFHAKGKSKSAKALSKEDKAGAEEWEWVCIDGGSDRIVRKMAEDLKAPTLNARVTRMAYNSTTDTINVNVAGGGQEYVARYSQVISTVPLGCLGAIDTEGLDLSYNQKLAIRSLQYDASVKVGLKFANRWWENEAIMKGKPIFGGQSSTDLPIRVCVYPSYGITTPNAPGVLIASYTWAQDARRVGSLCQGKGTEAEAELLELTLNNLCKLHGLQRSEIGEPIDYFAHSWYNDKYARGAFALFGPAQFGTPNPQTPSLYTAVKTPGANGRFHIAGEATSAHHAWVLGGLNSAWRAVYNALDGNDAKQRELIEKWGIPDEESEVHLKNLAVLGKLRAI